MARWSDYTTGERIKILRGADITQEQLAEAAGLSVATIRKAERDRGGGLPTLIQISDALHTDVSVVLGQQEPRRALRRDDRAMMRELSLAVHDTAAGISHGAEPPPTPEVLAGLRAAWDRYRSGQFANAGALAAHTVWQTAAALHSAASGDERAASGALADAYRLASYIANQFGARDLAYAAIGHASTHAERASDPVRSSMVASGRSWIYLRDARLDAAAQTAELSYRSIEPSYGERDPHLLATYGWHVTFAAVVAAREGKVPQAEELLSQGLAVATRLGRDVTVNGTAFGPTTVRAQAVGIHASSGKPAKALNAYSGIRNPGVLTPAARNRLMLDVALAQCDTGQEEASLDTLLQVCVDHPDWVRHQALPDVIARRAVGSSDAGSRYRKLSAILGTSPTIR